MREQVLQYVDQYKIIAIVRGADPKQCFAVAEALYAGGTTADTIGALAKEYEGRMFVGAGTVTSPELVELTAKAGGAFIISPDTDVAVIKRTRELGLVSMPGALTPSEIKTAHNAGADYVKVFPLGSMGPGYLKAIRAPLSHIKMTAVGGINEKNLKEYLEAGACGAGIGGNLANKKWIENGEFDKITEVAKQLVQVVEEFGK